MLRLPGSSDRWAPWVVRALWAALPLVAGPVFGTALAGASRPVQVVASAGLWSGWAAAVVATSIRHPVSLTVLRVIAPAALAATLAGAAGGHPSPVAVAWVAVVTAWSFSPAWAQRCVNGPAYPNERRFVLRAPGPVLAGPLALAWALAVAGLAAGPLLLAARCWVWGGVAAALGLPLAVVLLMAVHNLARRWAVFVPAGLVLHDPITLAEPVLVRRASVLRLGPALDVEGAADVSQRAPGLVLEIEADEEIGLNLIHPPRRQAEHVVARRVRFTPTRPGALLDEARARRFSVG